MSYNCKINGRSHRYITGSIYNRYKTFESAIQITFSNTILIL